MNTWIYITLKTFKKQKNSEIAMIIPDTAQLTRRWESRRLHPDRDAGDQ